MTLGRSVMSDSLKSNVVDCPVPGECDSNGVIYQATVKSEGVKDEMYVGLAKNFKKRFAGHKSHLLKRLEKGNTTLSTYFWKETDAGRKPTVKWKILECGLEDFNPVTGKCKLCTREKYVILFEPWKATLNTRQELFGTCRHKEAKLISKNPPKVKRRG